MTVRIVHKNSNQSGRNPTANQLANGELAINYNADGPFLSVRDTSGRIVRVGGVWLDGGAPANPAHGALWVDTDDNVLYIWDELENLWRQISGIGSGGGGGGGGNVNQVTSGDGINHAPASGQGNVVISASINNDTNAGGGGLEFDGTGRIQINHGNGLDINAAGELVSTVGALTFIGLVDCTQSTAANGVDGLGVGDAGNTWVNTAGPDAAADGSWGFAGGTTVDAGDMVIWNGTAFVLVPTGGGVGATDLGIANRTATTLDITSSTGADATVPFADEAQAGLFVEPNNPNNNTTQDFVRRSVRAGDGTQTHTWEEAAGAGGGGTVTSITPGVGLRQATNATDTGGNNDTAITGAGFIGLTNTAVAGDAGQFGNGTNVAQFTVDAQGRITQAANIPITATGLNQVNAGNGITVSAIASNEQTISARTGTGLVNNGGAGSNEITLQAATDAAIGGITEPGAAGDFIRRRTAGGAFSWEAAAAGGASVTISETPPAAPTEGDLWWNEDDGRLYVFYTDDDTSQWVDASPEAAIPQTPNLQEVTDVGATTTNEITVGGNPVGGANDGIRLRLDGRITASDNNVNQTLFEGFTTGTAARTSSIRANGTATSGNHQFTANGVTQHSFTDTNIVWNLEKTDALASGEEVLMRIRSINRSAFLGVRAVDGTAAEDAGFLRLGSPTAGSQSVWARDDGLLRISGNTNDTGGNGGTIVGTQNSDLRLKKNVEDYSGGLELINQLRPVSFNYKYGDDKQHLGFIAQEVAEVIPQSVYDTGTPLEKRDKDGKVIEEIDENEEPVTLFEADEPTKLAMAYVELIPALVNAVKELSAEVQALKGGA